MTGNREDIRRQAECATMLIAVAKLVLNAEPAEFAAWLRFVADDIEGRSEGPFPDGRAERFEGHSEPFGPRA